MLSFPSRIFDRITERVSVKNIMHNLRSEITKRYQRTLYFRCEDRASEKS
jgi:hypothetical protein